MAIHERLDDRRRRRLGGAEDFECLGAAGRERFLAEDKADACRQAAEYLLTVLDRPGRKEHPVELQFVDHLEVIAVDVLAPVRRSPVLGDVGTGVAARNDGNLGRRGSRGGVSVRDASTAYDPEPHGPCVGSVCAQQCLRAGRSVRPDQGPELANAPTAA